jgi:hypothetical protein
MVENAVGQCSMRPLLALVGVCVGAGVGGGALALSTLHAGLHCQWGKTLTPC